MSKRWSMGSTKLLGTLFVVLMVGAGAVAQSTEELRNPDPADWPTYGRTLDMQRYSPLEQIDRGNVGELRLAWSRGLEFMADAQFSPVAYDGVVYVPGPDRVIALDGATGEQEWLYTAELHENTASLTRDRNRGSVAVYQGMVFHALADGRVVALDAETGEEVWSTPVGQIEYGEGFSSGPIFADDKLIVGPSGADIGGVNGRVVALSAEEGEILWTFNIVPQPGEFGFDTWDPPSAAEFGGGSAWTPGAYDPVTNTVIYGTGQPIPWWSADDREGDNLFTSSYVALNAETGERKWHHQVIPHDEWDLDTPATPTVADLDFDGETRRTAILPTASGFIVLIDVETGEFLDAHQMHPDPSIHVGYEDDGTPIINEDARFDEVGETKTLCSRRWVDFEPAAFDPTTATYFRPSTHLCYELTSQPEPDDWEPGQGAANVGLQSLPDSYERLGGLEAVDPVSGDVAWDFPMPYAQRSGPVVTATGLVFMGSPDRRFRAFDTETGDVLWEQVLPTYMQANPITYAVDGTQYVAIPAGGPGGIMVTYHSDQPAPPTGEVAMFVFALPE